MGSAIAEVVPAAVSMVLINPLPIVAVVLLLLSPRAKLTAPAFVVGWVVGMLIVFGLLLFVAAPEEFVGDESEPSTLALIAQVVLGCGLIFLAFRNWRSRPEPGEEVAPPGWMLTLEKTTPVMALGFGAVLSGLNPKNLALTIVAVLAIAQADLATGEKLVAVAVYALIASVGIAVPVIWYLVDPDRVGVRATGWRDWLMSNYAVMMAIVLLLFGVTILAQGLGGLIG